MGLSTTATVFVITGSIGGVACILGLIYTYVYCTRIRPKLRQGERYSRYVAEANRAWSIQMDPGPRRPSKMVWAGAVQVRVPMSELEIKSLERNPQTSLRRPSSVPNMFSR